MNVLVLSNGEFEVRDISGKLEALQEIVGGHIEIPYISNALYENGIDIIINEEGKLIDGMKKEIAIVDRSSGQVLDIVFGNCIFASHDEQGNTVGLTEDQIKVVEKLLSGGCFFGDNSVARVLYV